jgi:hypothetical protein
MRNGRTALTTAALLGVLAFSACSAETTSRQAAADEPPVPEVESGEFLEEPILATSGDETTTVSGVTLCVRNQSSSQANVFLNADSGSGAESRSLGRGDELCVSGAALIGKDISGSIAVEGVGRVMDIGASRPWLWLSWVEFTQPGYGQCLYNSYFQNGGSTVEDGVLRYAIKRGQDTDRTNFRITLTDPRKKSSNGEPTKCA